MKPFLTIASLSVMIFMLLLAACGSPTPTPNPTPTPTVEPTPSPTPTPTAPPPTPTIAPSPTPTPVATPTATPTPILVPTPPGKSGGTLTTVSLANVPHFDVHQDIQETLTTLGPGLVYSRLLRLRTGPDEEVPQPSLLLECELCESWEMMDPLTYRFHIRQGIRWQNIPPVNGRELTADDVVLSYERQRTPGFPNAFLLQNIQAVEAEDPYTLKITLDPGFPDADSLLALANGHTKVVAREAVEEKGDLTQGPVIGSGPWIWKSTDNNIGSDFTRNPDYFEDGLPFLDEFVVRLIRDDGTRLAAFATGGVDTYRIPPEDFTLLSTSGAEFNSFFTRQGGEGLLLTMNVSAPPFDDHQIRKAVLKSLDPWLYLDTIWAGQGFVSLGMPVQSPGWLLTRDEMREAYFADPAGAGEILAGLDVPGTIEFDLTVADFGDLYLEQGRRLEDDLRSVGFAPMLRVLNPTQYADRVWRDKDYQLSIGVMPPSATTNNFLFKLLHSGAPGGNISAHSDAYLDERIALQAVETDSSARGKMARELQRYLLHQAYMISPVTRGDRWVYAPRVSGFSPNTGISEYFYWAKTWVE